MAQTYALIFAAPLLITILAIPILGERVGWRRQVAVLVGLAGVLVVIRPGAADLGAGHVAVLDLLALIDVLLNPADDLQLAALLRSPLFDLSEDELFALAHPRLPGQTLWSALFGATTPAG